MLAIYDVDGNYLGFMPLTEKQQALLEAGQVVAVQFHTPQLMRGELGNHAGVITLSKQGKRLLTQTPEEFKKYFSMQAAIKALRKQLDKPGEGDDHAAGTATVG